MKRNLSETVSKVTFLPCILLIMLSAGCRSLTVVSNELPPYAAVIDAGKQFIIASAVVTDQPWGADDTGCVDASTAIQQAISFAEELGGGVVYIPPGRYRIERPLTVGRNVTLQGERKKPGTDREGRETLLLAYYGRNDPDGQALITCPLHAEASIRDIAVYYPEQNPEAIVPYSWTIRAGGSKIRSITLYNSYNGIYMEMMNGSVVSDVHAAALNRGIWVPSSLEFSWMHAIIIDPKIWSTAPPDLPNLPEPESGLERVGAYMDRHLTGLQLGRLDGISVHDVAIPRASQAILIQKPASEDKNRVFGIGGIFSNIDAEITEYGWDGWYYGMRYANLDLIPESAQVPPYTFAAYRKAASPLVLTITSVPYGAVGDGDHDDTGAFLRALRDAGRAGGGTVYVPPGTYRIRKPLVVPAGVELRGPLGASRIRLGTETTVLEIAHGENPRNPEKARAAITLRERSGIRGLTILYPDQGYDPAELVPYPFSIRGAGEGVWVVDTMLANSWLGIDFASRRCDDHLAMDIWGTVFDTGIVVGGGSEHGVLERLAWSYGPWKEAGRNLNLAAADHKGKLGPYTYAHTTFYRFGDSLGEKTFGLAGFFPKIHMVLDGEYGGIRDAEFRHTLFDVAAFANILADRAESAAFYGFFGTGGVGGNSSWLESTDRFTGTLTFSGTTLQQRFLNVQLQERAGQFVFHQPASLTTGREADCRIADVSGTAAGSDAAHAFDDDWETAWTISGKGSILIDFGDLCSLSRWRIAFSGIPGEPIQFPDTVTVEVSLDGKSFLSAEVLYGNADPWLDRPFDTLYEARYVRITCAGNSGKQIMVDRIDLW